MNYTTGKPGRTIVIRLEDGEEIYPSIEAVARREKIGHAMVWLLGGITDAGIVVGPKDAAARPMESVVETIDAPHEILGVGTLFPNAEGAPVLHMHASMGRGQRVVTGCPRKGAHCWLVNEVVIQELLGVTACRAKDASTGFELLKVGN